jgi:predicted transcriptional regulator
MTISDKAKLREARRIAALNLGGRALDLAVVLLDYLNPEHGVAWPGVEDLADELRTSTDTIGRATTTLADAGVAKLAKRRGAAARWFPNLVDMEPEEAKRRVKSVVDKWKQHGPAKMRDHEPEAAAPLDDPAKTSVVDPAPSTAKVRDLKSTSNRSNINAAADAAGHARAREVPTEAAFKLVDELAKIAGLPKDSTKWPEPWRHAAPLVQEWLTELSERPFAAEVFVDQIGGISGFCAWVARNVMKRQNARAGAQRTIKYFWSAIKATADEMDAPDDQPLPEVQQPTNEQLAEMRSRSKAGP